MSSPRCKKNQPSSHKDEIKNDKGRENKNAIKLKELHLKEKEKQCLTNLCDESALCGFNKLHWTNYCCCMTFLILI